MTDTDREIENMMRAEKPVRDAEIEGLLLLTEESTECSLVRAADAFNASSTTNIDIDEVVSEPARTRGVKTEIRIVLTMLSDHYEGDLGSDIACDLEGFAELLTRTANGTLPVQPGDPPDINRRDRK